MSGGPGPEEPGEAQVPEPQRPGVPAGTGPFESLSDLAGKIPLFAELEKLLAHSGGPVNWELARQVAVRTAADGDRPLGPAETGQIAEALRLADVWLDPATTLPSGLRRPPEAWTRVRWVEATLPVWRSLCDPVAGKVVEAMGESLRGGLGRLAELPPDLAAGAEGREGMAGMLGPVMGAMSQVGSLMFGVQVGQALGTLAGEVVGPTEVGLPLGPAGVGALLPVNVEAFGVGLGRPTDEVRLYLALREAAHHRLFGHVPWLAGRLLSTVESYAGTLGVDVEVVQRALGELDPSDPAALQRALGGDLFRTEPSEEQQRILDRLETLLALIEGWVDEVVDAAAGPLPGAGALRETVRRRRASGGPAEQTFAALVGLTLRPRRLREAAELWRALREARDIAGRDAVWGHPDLLPTADDLADPGSYLAGLAGSLDSEPPGGEGIGGGTSGPPA